MERQKYVQNIFLDKRKCHGDLSLFCSFFCKPDFESDTSRGV